MVKFEVVFNSRGVLLFFSSESCVVDRFRASIVGLKEPKRDNRKSKKPKNM